MAPVRVVLFDLDDTLYDFQAAGRAGLEAVLRASPALRALSLDFVQAAFMASVEETHILVLQGKLDGDDARRARIRRILTLGSEPADTDVERATTLYMDAYRGARRPMPGVVDLLQALRQEGIRVAVVTNNLRREQEEKLRYCGLDALLDDLVTSEDAGEMKPHPAPFLMALRRSGCGPEHAVMVGDSWSADVLGALAAGIRPVWLNRTGVDAPNASLVREIRSFSPAEEALAAILGDDAQEGLGQGT